MTESVTEEIVQGEVLDFPAVDVPEPEFHTILEVWREVLKPARAEKDSAITPAWANKICQTYLQVQFADVPKVQASYFDKVIQLLEILEQEIDGDENCLKPATPEEDRDLNAAHYKNLILSWQLAILQWEVEWTCTNEDAAVEIAAISETQKMFFGEMGLVSYLDSIKFEFTDDDSEMLTEALTEFRESVRG